MTSAETPQETITQARLLKALADPTRLAIVRLLCRDGDTHTVSELARRFPLSQPTFSNHLCVLRAAGLVDYRKRAGYVYYFICPEQIERLQQIVNELAAGSECTA